MYCELLWFDSSFAISERCRVTLAIYNIILSISCHVWCFIKIIIVFSVFLIFPVLLLVLFDNSIPSTVIRFPSHCWRTNLLLYYVFCHCLLSFFPFPALSWFELLFGWTYDICIIIVLFSPILSKRGVKNVFKIHFILFNGNFSHQYHIAEASYTL